MNGIVFSLVKNRASRTQMMNTDIVDLAKNHSTIGNVQWNYSVRACLLLWSMLWMIGCGKPQLEPHNIHLTASLRTAISTRNTEWLTQNIEEIESRRASNQMGDQEYDALMSIIQKAQSGDWVSAEYETLALQKAQRPTQEQIQAIHEHKSTCEHKHN